MGIVRLGNVQVGNIQVGFGCLVGIIKGENSTGGRHADWDLSGCSLRLHNKHISRLHFPWGVFSEPRLSHIHFF